MVAKVSLGPICPQNWVRRPGELYSYLESIRDGLLDEQQSTTESIKQLESTTATIDVLKKLINPFIRASVHPLLGNPIFFDKVEVILKRDKSFFNLWENPVFSGCCALVDERVLGQREPVYRDEFSFGMSDVKELSWLEGGRAEEAIQLLEQFCELTDPQEEIRAKINELFSQVQQYLEDSREVFLIQEFKQIEFIPIILTYVETNDKSLEAKIDDVFVATKTVDFDAASSSSSPSSSSSSPIAATITDASESAARVTVSTTIIPVLSPQAKQAITTANQFCGMLDKRVSGWSEGSSKGEATAAINEIREVINNDQLVLAERLEQSVSILNRLRANLSIANEIQTIDLFIPKFRVLNR